MDLYELIEKANELAEAFVNNLTEVKPEALGLDKRAGYRLYVGEDVIAVTLADDRSLQYYGGFEYVDTECRSVVGEYVFYSSEDGRVAGHIAQCVRSQENED